MPEVLKSLGACSVHGIKYTKVKDKDAENGTVVSSSKNRDSVLLHWHHSLCDQSASYSSSLSWLHQTEPLAWQAFYHRSPVSCLRSSKQAHGKLSPLCGQMTLFSPSLKLLLEQNCKCCHRSGADLLTLGSQQPLPTHKQHWAKWGWAPAWGSNVCRLWMFVANSGQKQHGVIIRSMTIIYKQTNIYNYCCCQCVVFMIPPATLVTTILWFTSWETLERNVEMTRSVERQVVSWNLINLKIAYTKMCIICIRRLLCHAIFSFS